MTGDYLSFLPADLIPEPLPRTRSTWWRWRDMRVHILRVGEPDAPRQVIMLHGAGGHAGAMWPFAAILADTGVQVVLPDLPGYGRTVVPHRNRIRYPDWVELAADLVRTERDAHAAAPLLIGASMGGMLAYEAATRTGAADTVLATCLLDPRATIVREHMTRARWLGRYGPRVLNGLAGPLASVPFPVRHIANMRAIANDPRLVEHIVSDPLGGGARMPLGFLRTFLESAPMVEPERVTGQAVVLAHPAADRWTPVAASMPFFDRIAGEKELVVLDGAGHYPIETPGVHQLLETAKRCAFR